MACSGSRESHAGPGSPLILVEPPDPRIALARHGDTAILSHAIAHRHADPCDFSGAKPPLDSLADFHVALEALRDSLPAAVRKREAGTPVAERFAGPDSVRSEPGFLEAIRVGAKQGFRIRMGAEGCGEIISYLPFGPWTLRMARKRVAEFDPAAGPDAKGLAALPGVIPPREADELADRILASARIAGPDGKAIP